MLMCRQLSVSRSTGDVNASNGFAVVRPSHSANTLPVLSVCFLLLFFLSKTLVRYIYLLLFYFMISLQKIMASFGNVIFMSSKIK